MILVLSFESVIAHVLSGFPPREPDFLQCLALHNVAREFEVELGTKLARYPRLEELYLAPFKVPAEKPFDFSHLCPHLQNLRVLVLDIVGGCTFSDPVNSLKSHWVS